jgi:hypothetical protein
MENNFIKLASIDVSKHIEKKNGLSYLSWAWAVSELMKADPSANWVFHDPIMYGETMMVSCTVTAFGKPMTMHLPVMDHRNQAINTPDAFQINKNMMRCLVKAIALHGLGLYIYAGEDLPEGAEEKTNVAPIRQERKFDVNTAIEYIKKGKTVEIQTERARLAYKSATTDEERAQIETTIEQLKEQAA